MFESYFKTTLQASSAITTVFTGGIYTISDLGYKGLSRQNPNCSSAFDANGILLPCVVLNGLGDKNSKDLQDSDGHFMTIEENIQVYLLQHGLSGFTTIRNNVESVRAVLSDVAYTKIYTTEYMGTADNIFSKEINDAATIIMTFKIKGYRGSVT